MHVRQINRLSGVAILVIASLCGCASTSFPVVSEQQYQVAPNVLLAGELTEAGISALAGRGFLVVDLRTADEGAEIEAEQLDREGIARAGLPVSKGLSRGQVAEFEQLLEENGERRIIVHCASGNRAGILWAAHLIEKGASLPEAQLRVAEIVTKEPARGAIEDYANAGSQSVVR
jgi:rhodanese-related sulfurtransferase